MSTKQQNTNAPIYDFKISLVFVKKDNSEEVIEIKNCVVNEYNVSKDAINRNMNIHNLKISMIDQVQYSIFVQKTALLKIETREDGILVHANNYVIIDVNTTSEIDLVYSINLILLSKGAHELLNSYNTSTKLLKSNNGLTSTAVAIDILNKMTQLTGDRFGNDFQAFQNESCRNNYVYPNIRIPNSVNDLDCFTTIIKEYKPYLLSPYIIFDDFSINNAVKRYKKYNLIITNLCLIKSLPTEDLTEIIKYGNWNFIGSQAMIDKTDFEETLKSTMIIENKTEDKTMELSPIMTNSSNITYHEINEDLIYFKRNLEMKKKLVDSGANYATFNLGACRISDISFYNTYNLESLSNDYNNIPVAIDFAFTREQGGLTLNTQVTFGQILTNLN